MSIKDRGFASFTVTRQREIARLGGKASQAKGTGHHWTKETARLAGLKAWENRRAKAVQS